MFRNKAAKTKRKEYPLDKAGKHTILRWVRSYVLFSNDKVVQEDLSPA